MLDTQAGLLDPLEGRLARARAEGRRAGLPGIAAVTVFQSVCVWNDYFAPLVLIQKPELFTVQLAMGNFSNFYATDQAVLFAGLATAMVPSLLVFAVLQRSFIEGLTVGALRD